MKLTDELFERGKNSKQICTIVDDEYVLLTKAMPVTDDKLDAYIENLKKAKEAGINIACVEDYRLINEKQLILNDGSSYTRGVFLETRAKGSTLNGRTLFSVEDNSSVSEVVDGYIKESIIYLEELEKRAEGSSEFYDKLVSDYIKMKKYGLTVDPKPLNYYYDEEEGFTLIDPISYSEGDEEEYLPSYIIEAVYGYGRPVLYIEDYKAGLPEELVPRYMRVYNELNSKIIMALKKNMVKEEYIDNAFERRGFKTSYQEGVMEKEDILARFGNTHRI